MHIGLVLVTYSMFPEKLFASVRDSQHRLTWYVAHHGPDKDLGHRVGESVRKMGGVCEIFGNHGLSRSWNEGIKRCVDADVDLVLLLNDDLHFREGGFEAFVEFSASEMAKETVGLVFVTGYETDGPYKGVTQNQGFACCAMTRRLIDQVGYFDENFWPAYYEDVDYSRRMGMLGLQASIDSRCLVEHERSRTRRADKELAATLEQQIKGCQDYLVYKWSGDLLHAGYHMPFNQFGAKIAFEERAAPYGAERVRNSLAQ